MTTIKASCPCCGDVDLTPPQVRLVVCSVETWSYYSFVCETCHEEVRKPAAPQVVALLTSGGVRPERWSIPAEALEEHDGPAITHDDVLDLVLALQRVDLLSAVAAGSLHHRRPVG
jgi:hypothetical protein